MIPVAEACEECTLNCQLVHGKRNPSSVITTFFKVMFGDTYSEVMFLPPRFALTIQNLVRKEIQLEDSSGQKWPVRLNRVDGRLAFHEGWNFFSTEHNLKFGDFLVFHYIRGSHFVVSMYGESGCPETRHFGVNRHQKKKMRKKGKSLADDNRPSNMNTNGRRHSIASSSRSGPFSDHETIQRDADNNRPSNMKTNGLRHSSASSSQSGTIVSENKSSQRSEPLVNTGLDFDNENGKVDIAAETPKSADPLSVVVAGTPNPCVLEPFYMFDRDENNVEEESRRSLLGDLSAFENHMNQSNAGVKTDVAGGGYKNCGYEQGEFRRSLLDLSFEIQNNMTKNVYEECIQEPAENCNSSGVMPMEATRHNADMNTIPPTKKAKTTQTELGRTDEDKWVEAFQATSNTTTKVAKKKAAVTSDMDSPDSILHGNSIKVTKKEQLAVNHDLDPKRNISHGNSIKVTKKEQLAVNHDLDPKRNILHDYKPKDIKAGSRSSGSLREDLDQNTQCVKQEPVDLDDTPLPHFGDVLSLAVMTDTDYLELSPTFESRITRRGRPDAKVILLRVETDPNLFPVLYECKHGFKILSSSWRYFARKKRFNPGDTFEFRLENDAESIFRVRVVPK